MDYFGIRRARKSCRMTQEELAEALGVNRATISKYETGGINPSVMQLKKISEILNVPFSDLTGIDLGDTSESYRDLLNKLLDEYATQNGDLDASQFALLCYFDERGLRFRDGGVFDQLVAAFDQLNDAGQRIAVERIEELTEIPKYQR